MQNGQSKRKQYLLAALSGALLGLAFPPFGLVGGLLAFVALVPLLLSIERAERLRDTFWRAWVACAVLGLVSNYWVGGWGGIGEVDPFLMVAGVILAFVHPFFLVLPWLLYHAARRQFGEKSALLLLPVFYGGFEYWHSLGDLSYPWLSIFNTQSHNLAYIQFIEFTGPYLLTAVVVAVNAAIYRTIVARRSGKSIKASLAVICGCIVIPYLIGSVLLAKQEDARDHFTISVIQPSLNPWDKWEFQRQQILDTNFFFTQQALRALPTKPDLFLWPETAITFPITAPGEEHSYQRLQSFIASIGVPLLTGFPEYEYYSEGERIPEGAKPTRSGRYFYRSWNAAMLLHNPGEGFERETHRKQILVPLGEQVPFVTTFPILGEWFKWGVGLGSWNKGEGIHTQDLPRPDGDTVKLWTMICYESIYPSFVRKFVGAGAEILTIITNDGWYGKSSGPRQHNRFAVLRAIENRRWIARSANTGISSVIDDRGRMVKETELFVPGSITVRIPRITRMTLYTRCGDYLAIPAMWTSVLIGIYSIVRWRLTTRNAVRRSDASSPL